MAADAKVVQERRHARYEELRRRNAAAAAAGNYWLYRCFPTDGFDKVIEVLPEMVSNWAAVATSGTPTTIPPQAISFYVGLTEVLLQHVDWHRTAVALYRAVNCPIQAFGSLKLEHSSITWIMSFLTVRHLLSFLTF
jgi:hypothetical protein